MQAKSAIAAVLILLASVLNAPSYGGAAHHFAPAVLKAEDARHFFDQFASEERQFLRDDATVPWPWFAANVPLLDVPDEALEEIYYFRWFAFQKHIRNTPAGYVITEFLDDVPWAGKYNSIDAAAQHQLREARWLRDPSYAAQYLNFWFTAGAEPRRYSFPLADSTLSVMLATADTHAATEKLPKLVANYQAWQATHQDPNGLFWQIDDRDGMEDSIGGSGYRPTINSYMYGDALAIAKIAAMVGDAQLTREYAAKAAQLQQLVEDKLWNPTANFYETVPRGPGASWVDVRELIGYVPWYFNLPRPDRSIAWKQLNDPEGFSGAFGPTTAERRSPRFRFPDPHECLWNGPSWPFATTQTLVALANVLNGPAQDVIGPQQYWELLQRYVRSQYLPLPNGQTIPWIDEDLDPDTGTWIARNILEGKGQLPKNRGRYYNHSGFADILITGLLGLRASAEDTLAIHPLLPEGLWHYFALDGVPYHGHLLTMLYDETGTRYARGSGFQILCDGRRIYSNAHVTNVTLPWPARTQE